MSRIITVPSTYVVYEIEDDVSEMLPSYKHVAPPFVVLEVLVFEGKAKRLGSVASASFAGEAGAGSEEEEEPPEGEGPWLD
jgi:hypothetical protein